MKNDLKAYLIMSKSDKTGKTGSYVYLSHNFFVNFDGWGGGRYTKEYKSLLYKNLLLNIYRKPAFKLTFPFLRRIQPPKLNFFVTP